MDSGGRGGIREINLGEPIIIDDLPLLVTGSGILNLDERVLFVTGTTYLPWELSSGRRPPQPHPAANTIYCFESDATALWSTSLPNMMQGMALDWDGRYLICSYSSNPVFAPGGGSGMLVYELGEKGAVLKATYPVQGGVFHGDPLVSAKGNIVILIEIPQRDDREDRISGGNGIHILRW
jgi:hypothetical protein